MTGNEAKANKYIDYFNGRASNSSVEISDMYAIAASYVNKAYGYVFSSRQQYIVPAIYLSNFCRQFLSYQYPVKAELCFATVDPKTKTVLRPRVIAVELKIDRHKLIDVNRVLAELKVRLDDKTYDQLVLDAQGGNIKLNPDILKAITLCELHSELPEDVLKVYETMQNYLISNPDDVVMPHLLMVCGMYFNFFSARPVDEEEPTKVSLDVEKIIQNMNHFVKYIRGNTELKATFGGKPAETFAQLQMYCLKKAQYNKYYVGISLLVTGCLSAVTPPPGK
jgi:hypothetical protein